MSALAVALLAMVTGAGAAPPLAAARMAPPDAHAVIQVRGGLDGRSAGMRTLASGLRSLVDSVGAGERWAQAARLAELSPEALLRRCAGRDASLVVRGGREGAGWVLALEMDPRQACELVKALGGRMQGGARFDLVQLGLVGCVQGEWLLVSDRFENPLLRDMLRIAGEPGQPCLADTLPSGFDADEATVSVALRHDGLAQGISVWNLADEGARVRVRMRAALAGSPLGETSRSIEPEVDLEALPEGTIACWMQPMPRRVVPGAWCTDASSLEVMRSVEASLGARMAVFVGPRRDHEGPFSVAVAFELGDAAAGTRAHDAMIDHAAAALARLEARPAPCMGDRTRLGVESVRHCDERGLAESTFGTFECLGSVELHARTVPMRVGGWRVYATDVAWLDQVVGSIEEQSSSSSSSSSSIAGRWLRVGCLDGGALAAGLERWADARRSHGGCVKSLEVLAAVVRNAGPVTWRMAEPEPGRLEAEMVLRPVDASALDGAAMAGVRP